MEQMIVLDQRFIDDDLDPLGLHPFHHAEDAAGAEADPAFIASRWMPTTRARTLAATAQSSIYATTPAT